MKKLFYESIRDYRDEFVIEKQKLDYENPPHFHKNTELLYITDGEYTCTINGETYTVTQNEICFISPLKIHSANAKEGCKGYLVMSSDKLLSDFSSIFKNSAFPVVLGDKEFNKQRILPFIESIKPPYTPFIEKGVVNYVFGLLLSRYDLEPCTSDKNSDAVVKIVQYIDDHYAEKLTLEGVAEKLGYSKFYFSRLFNRIIKKSFTDYVNLVRTEKFLSKYRDAKSQTVTTLFYDCGFDSPTTFYRNFKKIYGVTPSEYFKQ